MLEIATPRLRLRPFVEADLDRLHALASDPEVIRYVGDGQPLDRAATGQWIANASASLPATGLGSRAVTLLASGELIGWAGLVARAGDPHPGAVRSGTCLHMAIIGA